MLDVKWNVPHYVVSVVWSLCAGAKEVQRSDRAKDADYPAAYVNGSNRNEYEAYLQLNSATRDGPQMYATLQQFSDK